MQPAAERVGFFKERHAVSARGCHVRKEHARHAPAHDGDPFGAAGRKMGLGKVSEAAGIREVKETPRA